MGAETPQFPDGPTPEDEARARRRKKAEEWDKCWDPPEDKSDEPDEVLRAWNFVPGDEFILDIPDGVPAVWGEGDSVGWAEGEGFLLVGPAGVGKSTVAQQLALGRLGLRDIVLGLPILPGFERVLYLAADRPSQIARSLHRMVSEVDRNVLADRLVIWRGPLPFDLVKNPRELLHMCLAAGADTLVIDSLKDVAFKLAEDEPGAMVNHAIQVCLEAGIQVLAVHHQRKQPSGGAKPKTLADVYGSTWITAGAGSVVLLWGEAGDAFVELDHLKPPAGEIGPLRIEHDHKTGTTSIEAGKDLWSFLQATTKGVTPAAAARFLVGKEPDKNETQSAYRKLEDYVKRGKARKEPGSKGGLGGGEPNRYFPVQPGEAIEEQEMFG